MYHTPVMPSDVSCLLVGNPNGLYVDATFGGGGHTQYLVDQNDHIKVIALDCDEHSNQQFGKKENLFGNRVLFVRDNFKNIKAVLSHLNIDKVDGILADLGVSSKQFDDLDRGFSFNSDILDMRMDNRNSLTAKEVVNSFSESDLADIFYRYGQERASRQIARAVVDRRQRGKINSGRELAEIVRAAKKGEGKIHPATKVFQSLRIFVNDELSNLNELLSAAPSLLALGGRIVVISFHSLEDRIVKTDFRANAAKNIYRVLTKKVVCASPEEMLTNPRSRSAKVRAAQKI
ncbi:MAG: 16S rRNA (cytosine(1402)-N(4))-methyltransferase RsmH [Elusimicrobiota bacterium]|jgi:16S rRNA (cytosine1402-N4)-methyltransferase|nr:16S rRNA (cytosine(1402)-N(4))-methyltransferase RsmH [Elusimicrobiota bacterium]